MMLPISQFHLLFILTLIIKSDLFVAYKMPEFSWDTLGGMVAFHSSNVNGQYPEDQLELIARHAVVTIEKYQALHKLITKPYTWENCQKGANVTLCGCCEEDYIIEVAKAVKAINPKVVVLMYTNTMLSYPHYRSGHNYASHPDWWLRDVNGSLILAGDGTWFMYDHSKQEISDFWATQCTNVTKTGFIDGCFMDGCTKHPGGLSPNVSKWYTQIKEKTMIKMQTEVPGPLICGSNGAVLDGVAASQIQNWGKVPHYSKREIPMLQRAVAKGAMFQAHGHCLSNATDPAVITSLAAFLVAAGKYSYYMCGGWNSYTPVWYPIYDFALGEPLGPAILKDGVYTRSFKSGTIVTYDTKIELGNITWSK